jgi:hypothetical protein
LGITLGFFAFLAYLVYQGARPQYEYAMRMTPEQYFGVRA